MSENVDEEFGHHLYTFGVVADVQGGDKPDYKFKFYRCVSDIAGNSRKTHFRATGARLSQTE